MQLEDDRSRVGYSFLSHPGSTRMKNSAGLDVDVQNEGKRHKSIHALVPSRLFVNRSHFM